MKIEDVVKDRGIREVLHYTTNRGLTGILAQGAIRPRKRLPADKYLEHIYKPNCDDRSRDVDWHDYVNLSITGINSRLFRISSNNWHRNLDGWWCILAFRAEILGHSGVFFTTTNNIYSGVSRAQGVVGLEKMYAPTIRWYVNSTVLRPSDCDPAQPTCLQAEVLYPGDLSICYLNTIYVRDVEHTDAVHGIIGGLSLEPITCLVSPRHFA